MKTKLKMKDNWKRILIAILVISVFFDGRGYSVHIFGLRVRSVQFFTLAFFGLISLMAVLGKWRFQRSPLDYLLLAYVAVNFVSVTRAGWKARSLKIALLIASLALLYWLVFQLVRTRQDFLFAFRVLLIAGIGQVGYGLYQVMAGAANHYWGWRLPVGFAGVLHEDFIGAAWGRPYGTLVEPDFYGAICMMLALIFVVLYSTKEKPRKTWVIICFLLALVGLYFSFVRTSWIFFFLFFLLMPLLRNRWPFFRFTWRPLAFGVLGVILFHFLAVSFLPPFQTITSMRFAVAPVAEPEEPRTDGAAEPQEPRPDAAGGPNKSRPAPVAEKQMPRPIPNAVFGMQNLRMTYMILSLKNFRRSPLLGNGPASFSHFLWLNSYGKDGLRYLISIGQTPDTNPNMLLTVLEDTGLIGLLLFAVIAGKILLLNFRRISRSGALPAPQALALFVGLSALFASYLVTTGFWLPMTWVFLGLNIASLERFPEVSEGSSADSAQIEGGSFR
jgi:hypothetical protein